MHTTYYDTVINIGGTYSEVVIGSLYLYVVSQLAKVSW
jgi:hypothetical protein